MDPAVGLTWALAGDHLGNLFVVWAEEHGATTRVLVARYDAQSDIWSNPLELGSFEERGIYPDVAVDASGDAYVVWSHEKAEGPVQVHRWVAAAAQWDGGRRVETHGVPLVPTVAAGPAGDVLIAWYELSGGLTDILAIHRK